MEQKFCQSCGMPLTEDILGTNADGSKNEDYCMYCYKDGKFLQECRSLKKSSARMPTARRMKITACTATRMGSSCRIVRWKR